MSETIKYIEELTDPEAAIVLLKKEITQLRTINAELVRALKQIGWEPIAVCGQGSIGLPDIIERMGEIARAALAKVGK